MTQSRKTRKKGAAVLAGAILLTSLTCKTGSPPLRCESLFRKENRVTVQITNSDELHNLYIQYQGLLDAGKSARLEVNIAPGTYGIASIGPIALNLRGSPPRDSQVDVVLRGTGSGVIFKDLGMQVTARSLHLENITFTKRQQSILQAQVKTSFTMKNCVVVDNNQGGPWGGSLLQVMGTPNQGAYSVEIEKTAFLRNSEGSQSALLVLGPASGSGIDEVRIKDSVFLDNGVTTDIAVMAARSISLAGCFVYKKRYERGQQQLAPTLLRYAASPRVSISGGVYVVDALEDIAAEERPPGAAAAAGTIAVQGAEVYLTASAPSAQPAYMKLSSTAAKPLSLKDREAAIADAIRSGSAPQDGKHAQLRTLFGLPAH